MYKKNNNNDYKTMNAFCKFFFLILVSFLLFSCSFFDKDNTPPPSPLIPFAPEINPKLLWSVKTGNGVGKEYLKSSPSLTPTAIITTSMSGQVTSVNKLDGKINWQVNVNIPISTGPAYGDGIIVVGSHKGEVVALEEAHGQILWQCHVAGELIAKPAISEGIVIVKTTDGTVNALSVQSGEELWSYQQTEPTLVLRASSAPLVCDRSVILGFANGNLAKLRLANGQLLWQEAIAIPEGGFPIQRMIDIDANPIIFDHQIYAATYQGKIASLLWQSGKIRWSHDISSYTGMVADANTVYISDAISHLWAFNAENGFVNWRQNQLESRGITGPVIMCDFIVVGDIEGYLHWMSKHDGHIAARIPISGSIYATPLVENNVLYAINNYGYLVAYNLER